MTDQTGPRHGDDSVYDPNPDTAYDDEYAVAPAAGGAAAGGAAADAGEGGEGTGGPPLRGLAMVLTAVAVVLIAWGIYSFVGGDDDDDGGENVAGQTTGQDASDASAASAAAGPTDSDDATEAAASDDPAESDDADNPDNPDGAAEPDGADGADNADGAGAVEVDRAGTAVTVLNNSGQPIAQATSDRLRNDHQWGNTGYGNLRGRIEGVSEETRVYYPEGNAQAQAAAAQVASDLGITAAPGNSDYYDRFGEADVRNGPRADGVVVVLTGPL